MYVNGPDMYLHWRHWSGKLWMVENSAALGRTKLAEMWFISVWSMVSGIKKMRIVSSCDSTCVTCPALSNMKQTKIEKTYKKNDNNNNKNINRNVNSKSYLFQCWPLYPNHTMMLRGTKKYISKHSWFLYSVSLDENYHRMFARMLRQTYALICTLFSSFLVLSEWNRISKALRINRHALK